MSNAGHFRTGQRPPVGAGRPKGAPNRVTQEVREAFAQLVEGNLDAMSLWLDQIAHGDPALGLRPDPAKALDIVIKLAEFVVPKLARVEATGTGGDRIKFIISAADASVC